MKKYKTLIIAVIVAAGAFAIGMWYGRSATVPGGTAGQLGARTGFANGARSGAIGRGAGGGGFAAGQVLAKDAESITLQLPNGNSEVVFYSTSTSIVKPAPASANDLMPGSEVLVGGTQNSDGSMTAQTIQIRGASSTPVRP